MTSIVIIASGAFVGAELSAEFGLLPPALLPVANRRLFELQVEALEPRFDRIALTIPDSFEMTARDTTWLGNRGVEVIPVDPALDLRRSLLQAIGALELESGSLAINHGDTLIRDAALPAGDAISVNRTHQAYRWAQYTSADGTTIESVSDEHQPEGLGEADVVSGFFSFSDVSDFTLSLALTETFTGAVDRYAHRHTVALFAPSEWLDFGHVNSYYVSRSRLTTERSFNDLRIRDGLVWKSSSKSDRVEAESHWFASVPYQVRAFAPQYLGRFSAHGAQGYRLEYLHYSSLADLFVFGRLPDYTWATIVGRCADFLRACREASLDEVAEVSDYASMHRVKTSLRLADWAAAEGQSLEKGWRVNSRPVPGLLAIVDELATVIEAHPAPAATIVHGDLCFSNILFDFRSDSVRVLDPRGQDAAGRVTAWGDQRYDAAKLLHSTNGLYDFIIAGHIESRLVGERDLEIDTASAHASRFAGAHLEALLAELFPGQRASIRAMTTLLFLSMLPLHADHPRRQQTLLANALRLYVEGEIDR